MADAARKGSVAKAGGVQFRVWGLGFGVEGFKFRVRVWGLWFRVFGFEFRRLSIACSYIWTRTN